MLRGKQPGERYCRMPLKADALLVRSGEMWDSEVVDISATGMLLRRPQDWAIDCGESVSVELLLRNGETISMTTRVARLDDDLLGLEYTRIPPRSEVPLWNLLGAYADATETLRHQA